MTYQLVVYLKSLYKKYHCSYCGDPIKRGEMACQVCINHIIEEVWRIS